MDTYRVEDGKLVKETICTLPGGESGAGEWCRVLIPQTQTCGGGLPNVNLIRDPAHQTPIPFHAQGAFYDSVYD